MTSWRKAYSDEVTKSLPEYGFIGEEGPESIRDTAWVVGPRDETVAFHKGLPEFGIALALKSDRNIVFSFLYRLATGDFFSAYKGQGAFKDGSRLRP